MSACPDSVPPQLAAFRATIDNLDAALVHLLAERFRCTQQVGRLKAELDLPPSDPVREERQVRHLRALAEESGLDPVFAEKFFAFVGGGVIRHHEALRAGRALAGARAAAAGRAPASAETCSACGVAEVIRHHEAIRDGRDLA